MCAAQCSCGRSVSFAATVQGEEHLLFGAPSSSTCASCKLLFKAHGDSTYATVLQREHLFRSPFPPQTAQVREGLTATVTGEESEWQLGPRRGEARQVPTWQQSRAEQIRGHRGAEAPAGRGQKRRSGRGLCLACGQVWAVPSPFLQRTCDKSWVYFCSLSKGPSPSKGERRKS